MLSSLHIENIAVIRKVDITFDAGFTALTGETGAGKSIVIDSIGLLLGARGDRELIRSGASGAAVSALFTDMSSVELERLASMGITPDEEGTIAVSRTLGADGHSVVRINGVPTAIGVLRAASPYLISVHGQDDRSALMQSETHARLLDCYAHAEEENRIYRDAYRALTDVRASLRTLNEDESARVREIEMLNYQLADIDAYALKEGEEDALLEKRSRLRNSEKIVKQASFAYRALRGNEKGNVSYLLDRSATALDAVAAVLPDYTEMAETLRDCMARVDDVAAEMEALLSDSEGDPTAELNRIEERLEDINKLKRKYGGTFDAVLKYRADAAARLEEIADSDARRAEWEAKEKELCACATHAADALHDKRAAAVGPFVREIVDTLVFLDMPNVRFDVRCEKRVHPDGSPAFAENGYDDIEFLLSANAGMPLSPVSKIASGGEAARIILAIKCALARLDGVSTVIFDEIDAGVSGKTARKIGLKLHELSHAAQIFSVTHSAQIASLADSHKLIRKTTENGQTETTVTDLSGDARVEELARILGGLHITEAQRLAARDMMQTGN